MPWVYVMPIEVVLDERGRVTLPAEVRRKLKLKKGSKLALRVEGRCVVLEPVRKIRAKDLFGLGGHEVVSIEEIERALSEGS